MTEPTTTPLAGRIAIITGGGSGIGQATCMVLARAGASVAVVDVNTDGARATLKLLHEAWPHNQALALTLDVRSEIDMQVMVEETTRQLGDPDILVTCAGLLRAGGRPQPVEQLSLTEWETLIETNLTGTFLANRAVLRPMMARRRGEIVNVSSMSGLRGQALDAPYCASKFGVIGFSEALAEEVRRYALRVHVVLPDVVATSLWEQNSVLSPPADALPPERVAEFIMYLVTLPEDTVLFNPVLRRFSGGRRARGR